MLTLIWKRTIMGREVVVAVTDGKLDFGTWEQIFYYEFDGKRTKRTDKNYRRINRRNTYGIPRIGIGLDGTLTNSQKQITPKNQTGFGTGTAGRN